MSVKPASPFKIRMLALSEAHQLLLERESGLTYETIKAAKLRTESDPARIGELLNWKGPARTR